LQLGLIHLAVAMTLVPINSTLNRVMIKELSIADGTSSVRRLNHVQEKDY